MLVTVIVGMRACRLAQWSALGCLIHLKNACPVLSITLLSGEAGQKAFSSMSAQVQALQALRMDLIEFLEAAIHSMV